MKANIKALLLAGVILLSCGAFGTTAWASGVEPGTVETEVTADKTQRSISPLSEEPPVTGTEDTEGTEEATVVQSPEELLNGFVESEDGIYFYIDDVMQKDMMIEVDANRTYYFDQEGRMVIDKELRAGDIWYYFGEDGTMQIGFTIQSARPGNTYYYNTDGEMQYGFQTIEGNTYYFHPKTGVMYKSSELRIGDDWYYFNEDGIIQTGFVVQTARPKNTYYYNAKGIMQYGFQTIEGNTYYFHPKTGVMYKSSELRLNGDWYYFDGNGERASGWTKHHNATYYYAADGKMQYGWQTIGGTTYFFNKVSGKKADCTFKKVNGNWLAYDDNGNQVLDLREILGSQQRYEIRVNKTGNTVTVYSQYEDGTYSVPTVAFICSTGWSTPVGTFYTPYRWRWLGLVGPSWGQWVTQITGDYLFHSVYYDSYRDNNTLSVDAYNNLGTMCSHGCVRLKAGDSKWIYDNCVLNTKVVIYNDYNTYGPLGKPSSVKLPDWHTWDPTDPNMYYKCIENGCH